jgi:hypothetical protein
LTYLEKGQVPVGQLSSDEAFDLPLTEKPDITFSRLLLPH